MPHTDVVRTDRLLIHSNTIDTLRASLEPKAMFESALSMPVASDWPHLYWDQGAVDWITAKIAAYPDEPFWRPWFIGLAQGLVVGSIGFKGPPDADGIVEIGYGVVSSHWRRGIASEAVRAMVGWALARPGVRGVCAHTLAGDPASSGVLRKCGFVFVRAVQDPTDGQIDRFELVRLES